MSHFTPEHMVLLSFTVALLRFLLQPPQGTEMVTSACHQADHEHLLTLAKPLSTGETEARAKWGGGNETWEVKVHIRGLKTEYLSVTLGCSSQDSGFMCLANASEHGERIALASAQTALCNS